MVVFFAAWRLCVNPFKAVRRCVLLGIPRKDAKPAKEKKIRIVLTVASNGAVIDR
jgi:hypothetical protein